MLNVNVAEHVIRYNSIVPGMAIFRIYTLNGKPLAEKQAVLTQAHGAVSWRELGKLPVGIYIGTMHVNDTFIGRVKFCSL